jgi:hypothetical protein
MSQDVRVDEEQITARRAQVLNINYVDVSKLQKQLFKGILSVSELYDLKIVPLVADEHYIHFGITTTTSQQTINNLKQDLLTSGLIFHLFLTLVIKILCCFMTLQKKLNTRILASVMKKMQPSK